MKLGEDMDKIKISIPQKIEYYSSVRLFISGILSNFDFDVEYIEDYKMAVTEGLNISKIQGKLENIEIELDIEENYIMTFIKGIEENFKEEETEMSKLIIESLIDKVIFEADGLKLIKIRE